MLTKPPKIDPTENEIDVAKKNTYKQSDSFLGLLDLFLRTGVYGPKVKLRPDIAGEIYSYSPPSPRMGKSTLPKPEHLARRDSDTKGKNRIGNIYDHKRQITPAEARHFHYYFTKAFGEEWGNLITPKELVTRPVADFIHKGLQAGLLWPTDLPVSYGLQSVFRLNQHEVFRLKYVKAPLEEYRGAQSQTQPRPPMQYVDHHQPVHQVGWPFVARVTGKKHQQVLLFETYDLEVTYSHPTSIQDAFSVFPLNMARNNRNSMDIVAGDGLAYEISALKGDFVAHALTFPSDWDFVEKFGVNPLVYPDPWTEEETRIFLCHVQKWLNHEPDKLQLASYAYRVV